MTMTMTMTTVDGIIEATPGALPPDPLNIPGGRCPLDSPHLWEAASPKTPASWGLRLQTAALGQVRPQAPAVGSLLDYDVASFSIHWQLPTNITRHHGPEKLSYYAQSRFPK